MTIAKAFVGTKGPQGRRQVHTLKGNQVLPLPHYQDTLHIVIPGWSWGNNSLGAKQLAIAILFDVTDDVEVAQRLGDRFWRAVVRNLADAGWVLTECWVQRWIMKQICPAGPNDAIDLGDVGGTAS